MDNINIAFNTIINCDEVRLGGSGSDRPTNVTFANNIFFDPQNDIFREQTGTETWIGNIASGDLGIPLPSSGLTVADPQLEQNSEGFFGLSENSPGINAAQAGYAFLPQFEGIDDIDSEVLFDLMGQSRPLAIEERDLGSNEFPNEIFIRPIATEENTGPSYNTSSVTTSVQNTPLIDKALIELSITPNPVANEQLQITIASESKVNVIMDIVTLDGKRISTIAEQTILPGKITVSKGVADLPAGIYTVRVTSRDLQGGGESIQTIKFAKSK